MLQIENKKNPVKSLYCRKICIESDLNSLGRIAWQVDDTK